VHLRAGGCSLVLDAGGPRLPAVLHWGADLGDPAPAAWPDLALARAAALAKATLDEPVPSSLVREHAAGWPGRPTLSGHRAGSDWSPSFALAELDHDGEDRLTVHGVDPVACLRLRCELELSPAGLLRLRHTLRNDGDTSYMVNELSCALPIPAQATELLDLSGRWCRERHQRRGEAEDDRGDGGERRARRRAGDEGVGERVP